MGEQSVVRTNISVPRDLKAWMEKVGERVNWSQVAAQAFHAKLLELESTKETGNMQDVIERLRAADELDRKQSYNAGLAAGEAWAKERARPKHLRALAELAKDSDPDLLGTLAYWSDTKAGNDGIAVALCRALLFTQDDPDERDVEVFWASAVGDDGKGLVENIEFAAGFCEGALGVWHRVKDAL